MRLSPDLIGLIEIEGDTACERLLSRATQAEPRWNSSAREVQSVTLLAANLAELTHELRVEWLTLMEELTASS